VPCRAVTLDHGFEHHGAFNPGAQRVCGVRWLHLLQECWRSHTPTGSIHTTTRSASRACSDARAPARADARADAFADTSCGPFAVSRSQRECAVGRSDLVGESRRQRLGVEDNQLRRRGDVHRLSCRNDRRGDGQRGPIAPRPLGRSAVSTPAAVTFPSPNVGERDAQELSPRLMGMSVLGYHHDLDEPVIQLWNDARH
jgi:hypothetical protein